MLKLIKPSLAVALSAALIGIPVMAMPANPASAPLGVILQADRAQMRTDIASVGATIYEGDRLETQDDGTLRARLGGSQMYLNQSSAAEVHGLSKGYSANLMHGTVIASSPEGQTFQVLANGITIRPAGPHATVARVTWVSAEELLLTTNLGAIVVSMGDETNTIEAGKSYRMEILPEGPGPQGPGSGTEPAHPGRRRRLAFILLGGAVAAGTAIGVWRATVSPTAP
jgi:ferric-dicitrate binding protein FerR (iron transport regulator)